MEPVARGMHVAARVAMWVGAAVICLAAVSLVGSFVVALFGTVGGAALVGVAAGVGGASLMTRSYLGKHPEAVGHALQHLGVLDENLRLTRAHLPEGADVPAQQPAAQYAVPQPGWAPVAPPQAWQPPVAPPPAASASPPAADVDARTVPWPTSTPEPPFVA